MKRDSPIPECPVCQELMEEITAYVTECCSAAMEEGLVGCPVCGAENPLVVKRAPTFACRQCGYQGT